MSDREVNASLARALELSRELLAVAEQGDVRSVTKLDDERRRLLDSIRATPRSPADQSTLREITALNDEALGFLEHRRRGTERQMDTVAVGRRALIAYSSTLMQR